MNSKLTVKAPAKINLYLEVSGKRPDGYHDIESVMQTVTLFDELTFIKNSAGGVKRITLTSSEVSIPCDSRNLVWRAAEMLFEAAGIEEYDLSVELVKSIPSSAGLGGGSSDAAVTFTALNELYGCGLDRAELCRLGAGLGADIPFLICGGSAVIGGIGEIIRPCPRMPDCYIAVACAGEGVSTPWAYKRLDEVYDFSGREVSAEAFANVLRSGELKAVCDAMTNIFESVVLPEREMARLIKRVYDESGAHRSMMSGSGPSVFGIFDSYSAAEAARTRLAQDGVTVNITKPYYPTEA